MGGVVVVVDGVAVRFLVESGVCVCVCVCVCVWRVWGGVGVQEGEG